MKTILIIGSGISGLVSAINVAKSGNKAIIASPYVSERAQSIMAAGGINAALNTKGENDSIVSHIEDTFTGGAEIASKEAISGLCNAAPEIIKYLESIGTVFSLDENNKTDLRSFAGQSHKRTAYAGASTGKQIVTGLVKEARKYICNGTIIKRLRLNFFSLLILKNECFGAIFYNENTSNFETIYADSVIMATGGLNGLFGLTTGSSLCTGYATGKLFTQGVLLKNLEFIQYHPTTITLPMKKMLITEAARGEGGRLFYIKNGKRVYFMEEKFGSLGNLMTRDVISKCIYDVPSQVYLDISFLNKKIINNKLSEVATLCKKYLNLDVTKEPIPVSPSVHFFMGGISVNINHETNIKRLYAVGECASMYHGANRLGGNSLLAAIYSGIVAAKAIEVINPITDTPNFDSEINEQERLLIQTNLSESRFSASNVRIEMAKIMNESLGIVRNEENLSKGIIDIDFYLSAVEKLNFENDISTYTGLCLPSQLALSKAILISAKERKESRGAHIRSDFIESKDEFKKASITSYNNGTIQTVFKKDEF